MRKEETFFGGRLAIALGRGYVYGVVLELKDARGADRVLVRLFFLLLRLMFCLGSCYFRYCFMWGPCGF